MFDQSLDERLSLWSEFRKQLDQSDNPLEDLIAFWKEAPFVPYNKKMDPFNPKRWPTPWDIIVDNKYDDFTKALMMAWTLKLTNTFKDSKIEIKICTDTKKQIQYNLVCVDEKYVVNYYDNEVLTIEHVPESFRTENVIEVQRPR